MVKWRKVPGETNYSVSSDGLVRNDRSGKILTPINNSGYLRVGLWDKKRKRNIPVGVHRLVASAFLAGAGETVNHKNGIKSDNRIDNLEWLSRGDNTSHGRRTGLIPDRIGEEHGMAKLTNSIVLEIRRRSAAKESRTSLAREYGVSVSTISMVALNKIWKHI